MSAARFLFVMAGSFDPTVIDSQVVDPIVAAKKRGISFDLLALVHGGPWWRDRAFIRERRREIAERIGGRVIARLAPRQDDREGELWAAACIAAEAWRGSTRRTVVHSRADAASYFTHLASRLHPGLRYVYDLRGDSLAEFLQHPDAPDAAAAQERHAARIRRHRRVAALGASHVFCVSTVLRDRVLVQEIGISPERVTVVPCVADPAKFHLDEAERGLVRRELGLTDRFVIVYPGRFGRWHYGPEMLRVAAGLLEAFPDAYFLVLTPDLDEARALGGELLPAGRWDARRATHAEVPRYLRAADLGLLLRERHPLNEAACPTKFAEYMMSGVPVLISGGIGDCSPWVASTGAGAVLEEPDPVRAVEAVKRLRAEDAAGRRARIAGAAERFSRERIADEMAAIYRRVAEA